MQTGQSIRRAGDGRLEDYVRAVPGLAPYQRRTRPAEGVRAKWPPTRAAAVGALWGAGFVEPGGAQETLRLAEPLGLNRNASLLLLGGGMGGPAETVVETFGSWVASFEADEELVGIAEARRAMHPSGQRMQVAGWDRSNPSFGSNNAHHAMALEAARGASVEAMLGQWQPPFARTGMSS